jgi:uncharacterized RDD family membrane protein YckC
MNWYYANSGQRQGPITQAEFERLVGTSVITDQTLVWNETMPAWKAYGEVRLPSAGAPSAAPSAPLGDDMAVCAVSGKVFSKREMIQYEGKWVSAPHRDEFFQRLRQGIAPADEMRLAGFWVRFLAKIIDGIIVGVVSIPVNMLCAFFLMGSANYFDQSAVASGGDGLVRMILFQVVTTLLGFAIGVGYCLFFIPRYQATPGKMALGLKIVRADGTPLSKGRIVGRYFAELISMLILWIGYILAAFDDQKRALHDMICDTRVIKK